MYCSFCLKPCDAVRINYGPMPSGPNDSWGLHHDVRSTELYSACCEAEILSHLPEEEADDAIPDAA
jgi:hypothetical protein